MTSTQVARLRAQIGVEGRRPQLLFDLSRALMFDGDLDGARHCLSEAIRQDPGLLPKAIHDDNQVFVHLTYEAIGRLQGRVSVLTKPSGLLGTASRDLDAAKQDLITHVLDRAANDWLSGVTPKPDLSSFDIGPDDLPLPPLKVLLAAATPDGPIIDCDYVYHFLHSAFVSGIDMRMMNLFGLLYASPTPVDREGLFQALEAEIEAFKPNVILIDANFAPSPDTITPDQLRHLRNIGVPMVALISDSDENTGVPMDFWAQHCDLVLAFNRSSLTQALPDYNRLMLWPCFPFTMLMEPPSKTHDIGFFGRLYRGREVIAHYLEYFGLNPKVIARGNDNRRLPIEEYITALSSVRMTFNTGFLFGDSGIATGRIFEAIMCRTLVLEEIFTPPHPHLVPFVHYVPISNAHEAVIYAQYFLAHPDKLTRITDMAFDWVTSQFSPQRFWANLADRLHRLSGKDHPLPEIV